MPVSVSRSGGPQAHGDRGVRARRTDQRFVRDPLEIRLYRGAFTSAAVSEAPNPPEIRPVTRSVLRFASGSWARTASCRGRFEHLAQQSGRRVMAVTSSSAAGPHNAAMLTPNIFSPDLEALVAPWQSASRYVRTEPPRTRCRTSARSFTVCTTATGGLQAPVGGSSGAHVLPAQALSARQNEFLSRLRHAGL